MDWIRRMFPDKKTIGVLFNSKENLHLIVQARLITEAMGLTLFAKQVESPKGTSGGVGQPIPSCRCGVGAHRLCRLNSRDSQRHPAIFFSEPNSVCWTLHLMGESRSGLCFRS